MSELSRCLRILSLSAIALGLTGVVAVHSRSGDFSAAAGASDSGSTLQTTAPSSGQADDFVHVQKGKFILHGRPFVMRGINYFGSWRIPHTIPANGAENATVWALYHEWNVQAIDADFKFIRSRLNATVVRIGTPSESDMANLIKFHGYEPWSNPDGTITEKYKLELIKLADLAYANGIRIHFSLIWHLKQEVVEDPDGFKSGARMDAFYSNQVRSIVAALRDNPGVVSYSIGNETLEMCQLNCQHPSWFESETAGFMVRRYQEIRTTAPHQLLTADETIPARKMWYFPGKTLIALQGVDAGRGIQSFRLADIIDYLGPHFYPVKLDGDDLRGGFDAKLEETRQKLDEYMHTAAALGKPIVIDEFGLRTAPEIFTGAQFIDMRTRFYQVVLTEGRNMGLQGALAWGALPEIVLPPNHYVVRASTRGNAHPEDREVDIDAPTRRQIFFFSPSFCLFEWRSGEAEPASTSTADALAASWPGIQ